MKKILGLQAPMELTSLEDALCKGKAKSLSNQLRDHQWDSNYEQIQHVSLDIFVKPI